MKIDQVLDISQIKKYKEEDLINRAKEYGLKNIKSGYLSHQAVFKAVCNTLFVEPPPESLRVLSGFGGGIAFSGEVCGALCGGIASMAYFFGTSEPVDFTYLRNIVNHQSYSPNQKIQADMDNAKKEGFFIFNYLYFLFKKKYGTTKCRELIATYFPDDLMERKRFLFCQHIVSNTSGLTVQAVLEFIDQKINYNMDEHVLTHFLKLSETKTTDD